MSQYSIIYCHKFAHRLCSTPDLHLAPPAGQLANTFYWHATRAKRFVIFERVRWVLTVASVRSASCSNSWCLNERLSSCWYGFFSPHYATSTRARMFTLHAHEKLMMFPQILFLAHLADTVQQNEKQFCATLLLCCSEKYLFARINFCREGVLKTSFMRIRRRRKKQNQKVKRGRGGFLLGRTPLQRTKWKILTSNHLH